MDLLYVPQTQTGFLVFLALFLFLCCEGSFWLAHAVKPREWIQPLAFFGGGFYFMAGAGVYVLTL